jgi:hypothetical protein
VLSRFALDGQLLEAPFDVVGEIDASSLWMSLATVAPGDYLIASGGESVSLKRVRIP